ncbi:hypothetical protein WG66_007585 [Moniliophthora roreri]|nr:hypothetical protein WG66_007585 [Moniliophthora roreri]
MKPLWMQLSEEFPVHYGKAPFQLNVALARKTSSEQDQNNKFTAPWMMAKDKHSSRDARGILGGCQELAELVHQTVHATARDPRPRDEQREVRLGQALGGVQRHKHRVSPSHQTSSSETGPHL